MESKIKMQSRIIELIQRSEEVMAPFSNMVDELKSINQESEKRKEELEKEIEERKKQLQKEISFLSDEKEELENQIRKNSNKIEKFKGMLNE